jgi:BirA family biotin operon repressor/biotin-[acetyl-CoA-carboxylase] ligase
METLFIGRQRFEEEQLLSTNAYALNLLRNGLAREGAIVITKNQTAGRGQRGNTWEAEPGKNLTMSIVLMPSSMNVDEQFVLTKISSLAVVGFLGELMEKEKDKLRIKWPNDIYVGSRKIAGILIENVVRDNQIAGSVVGIGLNINQEAFHTAVSAVSMKGCTGIEFNLRLCEEKLCEHLESRYLQFRAGQKVKIDSDYRSLLYKLNEEHRFSSGQKNFSGIIQGVTAEGKIRIILGSGEQKDFDLKELKFEQE